MSEGRSVTPTLKELWDNADRAAACGRRWQTVEIAGRKTICPVTHTCVAHSQAGDCLCPCGTMKMKASAECT